MSGDPARYYYNRKEVFSLRKKILTYLAIALMAVVTALNYQIFVFPNRFAPAGLNGICTMFQYISGISMGYLSLIINVPLALLVYRKVSKVLAIRSMVFVLTFSLLLPVLSSLDLSRFAYETENGTSKILGPLVAGIVNGGIYGLLVRGCAYTGGTDFVASIIHKYHPEQNFFWITFTINVCVAVSSYFVYDFQIEPVILCIVYCFMSSTVSDRMVKSGRSAVRFEIVTEEPDEIYREIMSQTHHTATLMPGKGMYQGKPTNVMICIINKTQVSILADIVRRHPNTFAVMSSVAQVVGNFRHLKNDGQAVNNFLDEGDGPAV